MFLYLMLLSEKSGWGIHWKILSISNQSNDFQLVLKQSERKIKALDESSQARANSDPQ